ncbi:hypothetical protein M427DRAFT_30154 [Gonapodya prolifera JEL478]|uniref:SH3 domain-containing protein n=1 Tax=Gonapodya prolifera (strain JEL478) TaxID=1344416 RepID=A0A139AMJ3_GONPJ|nr:hypothetical protein M427DRAFT_30154 [Gonapodya prolifera JEL478]|eukprot:KXS17665.1 hypothetical protein M427DRAFT_30154 [Gonapodya prolifera JEL478]
MALRHAPNTVSPRELSVQLQFFVEMQESTFGNTYSATNTPSTSPMSAYLLPPPPPPPVLHSLGKRLSGAIGGGVGAAAAVVFILAGVWYFRRVRNNKKSVEVAKDSTLELSLHPRAESGTKEPLNPSVAIDTHALGSSASIKPGTTSPTNSPKLDPSLPPQDATTAAAPPSPTSAEHHVPIPSSPELYPAVPSSGLLPSPSSSSTPQDKDSLPAFREVLSDKTGSPSDVTSGTLGTDGPMSALKDHWFFTEINTMEMIGTSVAYNREPLQVLEKFSPDDADEIALFPGHFVQLWEVFRDGWGLGWSLDTGAYGMIPLDCLDLTSAASPNAPPRSLESRPFTGSIRVVSRTQAIERAVAAERALSPEFTVL